MENGNKIRRNIKGELLWGGNLSKGIIEKNLQRNYIHLTSYSYCQHGGLFDQTIQKAGCGQAMLKKDKPITLYGGYNKVASSFFVLVLFENTEKQKRELTFVPVDLMSSGKVLNDSCYAVEYVKNFMGLKDEDMVIKFPLGIKPIKVKSVMEVDGGLRFRINGKSNGGRTMIISMFTPLILNKEDEDYIKRLESIQEKFEKNKDYNYSFIHDKISVEKNLRLYNNLIDKLRNGVFELRPSNPSNILKERIGEFEKLPMYDQVNLLLEIVSSFGINSNSNINITCLVGAKKGTGATTLSANLSNWKNNFHTAYLVNSDAAGLHETKSVNLLDLI